MSHPDKHRSLPPDCIFGVCNTRAILASYTTLHKISLNRLIRYVSRGKRPEMKQLIDTPANSHDFPVDSASTFRPYRNTLPSPPVSGPPSPISFAPYQHKYICIYISSTQPRTNTWPMQIYEETEMKRIGGKKWIKRRVGVAVCVGASSRYPEGWWYIRKVCGERYMEDRGWTGWDREQKLLII